MGNGTRISGGFVVAALLALACAGTAHAAAPDYPIGTYAADSHVTFANLPIATTVDENMAPCAAASSSFEVLGCYVNVDSSIHLRPAGLGLGGPVFWRQAYYHEMCHALDFEGVLSPADRALLLPVLGYRPGAAWFTSTRNPPFERFAEACSWIAVGRLPRATSTRNRPADRVAYGLHLTAASFEAARSIIVAAAIRGQFTGTP